MEIPYRGRFSIEQISPVIEAAGPVPPGDIEWRDETGDVKRLPRLEAAVRSLEWIDTLTQVNVQQRGELSPSAAGKRFHAIAAAADTLLGALHPEGGTALEAMPRQVSSVLASFAEKQAQKIAGFSGHAPSTWQTSEGAFTDFHATDQLRDDIEGVRHIRDWAYQAEKLARSRVARDDGASNLSELSGLEPGAVDPINAALDGILGIWTDILGQEIQTAVDNNGIAYGRLIEFGLACLRAVNLGEATTGAGLGSDAVRGRIRRMADARLEKSSSGH